MSCRVGRDPNGEFYIIDGEFECSEIAVWWNKQKRQRNGKLVIDEKLIIKQINGSSTDVLELTQGQVYGLIAALNNAIGLPIHYEK
jgi:hypothetical protein